LFTNRQCFVRGEGQGESRKARQPRGFC
jgi:hypothetical protein